MEKEHPPTGNLNIDTLLAQADTLAENGLTGAASTLLDIAQETTKRLPPGLTHRRAHYAIKDATDKLAKQDDNQSIYS